MEKAGEKHRFPVMHGVFQGRKDEAVQRFSIWRSCDFTRRSVYIIKLLD